MMVVYSRGETKPILNADDFQHFQSALAYMNMTVDDAGFEKDVGEPQVCLSLNREILKNPMLLPGVGDEIMDILASNNDQQVWTLVNKLLEVSETDDIPEVGDNKNPWRILSPALAVCLDAFYADAMRAHTLMKRAFEGVSEEDQRYLVSSYLSGVFNAEDKLEVREALGGIGVTSQDVARAISEGMELDPGPSSSNYLVLVETVEMNDLLEAGQIIQQAAYTLADSAFALDGWWEEPTYFETPIGQIIIGSTNSDAYTEHALLIFDPDGNDRYQGASGVANGLLNQSIAVVIDLKGNDWHSGDEMMCFGEAILGSCVTIDFEGDDVYHAAYSGQGAAVYGTSWLEDRLGDDSYRARGIAQGAATVGFGFLNDVAGNDIYDLGYMGQGFGGVYGVGFLFDQEGNDRFCAGGIEPDYERHSDRYISLAQGFAIGMRPFAGGGVGALVDFSGNDAYEADIYGQGVSYWYSTGLLLDRSGNDEYSVYHYGQGTGIHLSSGLLADYEGNDRYSGYILAQGSAHDYAVGMLVDQEGDDTYTADHYSQSRALYTSFSLLVDRKGNDAYFARQNTLSQGMGSDGDKREYGSLAVLMDLEGHDQYSNGAEDGARLLRPDFGIVYDFATNQLLRVVE